MELCLLNINHPKLVYTNWMSSIKVNLLLVRPSNFMSIKCRQDMSLPMVLVLAMVFAMNLVASVLSPKMPVQAAFLSQLKAAQKLKFNVKITKMVHAM